MGWFFTTGFSTMTGSGIDDTGSTQ